MRINFTNITCEVCIKNHKKCLKVGGCLLLTVITTNLTCIS